ncbi:MAG: YqeG family HAD IIIA-type phosphatase [Clostridiales bacterium]|nr:YqeG family HAD IIIA-type phosphatase [Clostridiales bacterium]
MRDLLRPALERERLTDLDAEELRRRGIEALILDLDNTLLPWGSRTVDGDTLAWIGRIRRAGLKICVLTNGHGPRARSVCEMVGVMCIWSAGKPFPGGFRRAQGRLQVPRERCAVVGDQLFTDILGGNAAGFFTVLVSPLSAREMAWTRFVRHAERALLKRKIVYKTEENRDE